ncbi:hypothetical protein F6J84_05455 [Microbacterium caowuchunii]|uniref:hypothetical protein n=1 Tax=Microbacterium caowuchunii TaxID=2614638 RepID=UPI001245CF04|nr:hypothetical protein [Microbacterium caowuchunii]QEV99601.1 hypothetical protein F6J84_05455 [Microbacterium caowuchunii]
MSNDRRSRAAEQHTQLIGVGPGAWCVCDASVPENDARRLIAYLERVDGHVEVVWVHERRPPARFESLTFAFDAVRDVLTGMRS